MTEKDRDDLITSVGTLVNAGNTQREIASKLNISLGAVNKYKKLQEEREKEIIGKQ